MNCDVGEVMERLENELCYDYNYELCFNLSITSPTSQRILQPFRHFTYVTAHSPTLPLLHLRHSSISNPSFALLILQPFRHFTYVTAHSPTLLSLYLRHSSFSNPSVASPTSQLNFQPFFRSAHSPTFPTFHLRHSSFSNPYVALPKSQLILQPFRCFTYVTAHSVTLLSLLLRHRLFTYVTWRADLAKKTMKTHSIVSIIYDTSDSKYMPT